ncbi:MAG TPA: hypothetical protein VN577_03365 [Terriglobales bacterium]|nr:hypothetical protein [Terriglobales bacterium]
MNIDEFKAQVKDIAELSATVPEPFREKCFEVLLQHLIRQADSDWDSARGSREVKKRVETAEEDAGNESGGNAETPDASEPVSSEAVLRLNSALRVFMRRTKVTQADIEKVVMVEGNQVYFLKEPTTSKVAQGQLEWSLLTALKNGILRGSFTADAEEIRSICQEKGFYDQGNFAAIFKRDRMKGLFKAPLEKQGDPQPLTNDGLDALGNLLKELGGSSE